MPQSPFDRVPTLEECLTLMMEQAMLPNIAEHSRQVMRVSLAIADHLKNPVVIHRDAVMAAALLHDITKTRSLETRERHDLSGGALLRSLGFPRIAEIVEQHVYLAAFDHRGALEECEIIFYADKRVMHDRIVTIDERLHDLVKRYGINAEIRKMILQNKEIILAVETKIAGFMRIDLEQAIDGLRTEAAAT